MGAEAGGDQWNVDQTLIMWEAMPSKELGRRYETRGVG
jgi:hypothetical protein